MSTEEIESFSALMDRHEGGLKTLSEGSRDGAAYLLSPERAQRFELLTLLICNLGKPLAVCGPEGIGKTTFLGLLEERAFESWQVVSARGNSVLQYSDIIARIAEQAAIHTASESAVKDYLEQMARNKSLLVLLLDDAGKLAPGVLTSLWQFSRDHSAFRLVLALRPDEAQLKTATDGLALGECHFVDIPALTAPLCKAYLRRLATRPPRILSTDDITPARVRALYRATHGVPGRIVQMLTEAPLANSSGMPNGKMLLLAVAVCAALLSAALMFAWYKPAAEQAQPTQAVIPISPPKAELANGVTPPAPIAAPTAPAPVVAAPVTPAPAASVSAEPANNVATTPVAVTPSSSTAVAPVAAPPSEPLPPAKPTVVTPAAPTAPVSSAIPAAKEEPPAFKALPSAPSTVGDALPSTAKALPASADNPPASVKKKPSKAANDTPTKPDKTKADKKKRQNVAQEAAPSNKNQRSALKKPEAHVPPVGKPATKTALKSDASKAKPAPTASAHKPKMAQAELEDLVDSPAKSAKPKAPLKTAASNKTAPSTPAVAPPQPKPVAASPAAAVTGQNIAGVRPTSWLLSQPGQSYTLRVMLVREWSSIKTLMQRYPAMQGQVITFKSHTSAGEWHSVYYGVFASEAEARQAATKLPAALGKALPRQIKQVQQEAGAGKH